MHARYEVDHGLTEGELYGHALSNQASICLGRGDLRKALELYQQSLAITERTAGKDNASYATTLTIWHWYTRIKAI